jgi:hypothetical protein
MIFAVTGISLAQQMPQPELREDFSDNELENFVKTNATVTEVYAESEKKMISTIEEEGLSVDRFNELIAQQQDPEKEVDATQQELVALNNAAQTIMKERQAIQSEVTEVITENGLDVKTYQEIMFAYQKSPKIKEKIDKMVQEEQ